MTKKATEDTLGELEKIRRMLLKSYLYFTYQVKFFCKDIDVSDVELPTVTAAYCGEAPRAVLFRISGKIPPSLNARLDFSSQEDRNLWLALKTWWHGSLSAAFASHKGKFPYAPLCNPIVFAHVSATGKIYDLDNYGLKAVMDALESLGVIRRDGDVEWFFQRRVKGKPEIEIAITECNGRLRSSLSEVEWLLRNRRFETIDRDPATAKTGNAANDFYSCSK